MVLTFKFIFMKCLFSLLQPNQHVVEAPTTLMTEDVCLVQNHQRHKQQTPCIACIVKVYVAKVKWDFTVDKTVAMDATRHFVTDGPENVYTVVGLIVMVRSAIYPVNIVHFVSMWLSKSVFVIMVITVCSATKSALSIAKTIRVHRTARVIWAVHLVGLGTNVTNSV